MVDGEDDEIKVGKVVDISIFEEGDYVSVRGKSKGKGFQGVVKRHGFAGVGDATHGQHNRLRAPGSIGMASTPSKVLKGIKMAGRTGQDQVKEIKRIEKVIADENLILVRGAVAGAKGTHVVVERS